MQVENTDFTVAGFDSDYMLSRLVVSLIILNICGVRLQCILLLIVFIETCYSCCIAYGFMLV